MTAYVPSYGTQPLALALSLSITPWQFYLGGGIVSAHALKHQRHCKLSSECSGVHGDGELNTKDIGSSPLLEARCTGPLCCSTLGLCIILSIKQVP